MKKYNIKGGHKDKDTGETLPILNGAVWGSGIYAAPGVDFASNYAQKTNKGEFKSFICLLIAPDVYFI